jgi:probable rRNA maturation factor
MTDPDDPGGPGALPRVSVANEQRLPVDVERVARFARDALDLAGVPAGHALSVALVSPARIAELKGRYFGRAHATDVLSFPMDPLDAPAPATLGDVVICVEVARRQARGLGLDLARELEHLLAHGILHLAGHDHADVDGELRMAAEERRILGRAPVVASR